MLLPDKFIQGAGPHPGGQRDFFFDLFFAGMGK
jgi:hypothetical protein